MTKKVLLYTGILVGSYLVLANATGFGKAVSAGASGYSTVVRTLQGR